MTQPTVDPGFLSLAFTGWYYIKDVYWLLTTEGAREKTQEQIERLKQETAARVISPRQGAVPPLPEEVQPTLTKINNIMNFMVPTTHYLGEICFYTSLINYGWHVLTRFFTSLSLTLLVSAAVFFAMHSDLKKMRHCSTQLQKKFDLVIGESPEASLKRIQPHVRVALTKSHIQDALEEVRDLSKSLTFLHYILFPVFNQMESHLLGLDLKIQMVP